MNELLYKVYAKSMGDTRVVNREGLAKIINLLYYHNINSLIKQSEYGKIKITNEYIISFN